MCACMCLKATYYKEGCLLACFVAILETPPLLLKGPSWISMYVESSHGTSATQFVLTDKSVGRQRAERNPPLASLHGTVTTAPAVLAA